MNCKDCTENLSAFLDEELADADRLGTEDHLQACAPCAAELASLRRSAELVDAQLEDQEPGPHVWKVLEERIGETENTIRGLRRWTWLQTAAAGAVTLVLLAGGWRILESQREEAALRNYMSQYVQSRDSQEQHHRSRAPSPHGRRHPEFSENPFISDNDKPEALNPFLGDGR